MQRTQGGGHSLRCPKGEDGPSLRTIIHLPHWHIATAAVAGAPAAPVCHPCIACPDHRHGACCCCQNGQQLVQGEVQHVKGSACRRERRAGWRAGQGRWQAAAQAGSTQRDGTRLPSPQQQPAASRVPPNTLLALSDTCGSRGAMQGRVALEIWQGGGGVWSTPILSLGLRSSVSRSDPDSPSRLSCFTTHPPAYPPAYPPTVYSAISRDEMRPSSSLGTRCCMSSVE